MSAPLVRGVFRACVWALLLTALLIIMTEALQSEYPKATFHLLALSLAVGASPLGSRRG